MYINTTASFYIYYEMFLFFFLSEWCHYMSVSTYLLFRMYDIHKETVSIPGSLPNKKKNMALHKLLLGKKWEVFWVQYIKSNNNRCVEHCAFQWLHIPRHNCGRIYSRIKCTSIVIVHFASFPHNQSAKTKTSYKSSFLQARHKRTTVLIKTVTYYL